MCVAAAAACTRCFSKRSTTIYMYIRAYRADNKLRNARAYMCRMNIDGRSPSSASPPQLRTAAAASDLYIRESVHSLCRDGADTPIKP